MCVYCMCFCISELILLVFLFAIRRIYVWRCNQLCVVIVEISRVKLTYLCAYNKTIILVPLHWLIGGKLF